MVYLITDSTTLASLGADYTVLRDYGDVFWAVRMNINDLTNNFTENFTLPEARSTAWAAGDNKKGGAAYETHILRRGPRGHGQLYTGRGGGPPVSGGLRHGSRGATSTRTPTCPVPPGTYEALLLTHAHIDHSGRIPYLYKNGYRGPVYTTEATRDLCAIMLEDSAHIQEQEAEWKTARPCAAAPR